MEVTNTQTRFPQLLTIRQAAKVTSYPEHLVRSLVASGAVKSVPAGTRRYVVLDSLIDYVSGRE